MKRLYLIITFALLAIATKAQISTSSWHDGYWGQWKSHTTTYTYSSLPPSYDYELYGDYSGFIIYSKGSHPSEYIFKFNAYGFSIPDKKTLKSNYKNKKEYEYSGTVEYYVTERYPTINAILRAFEFPEFNYNSGSPDNPCVKRVANAKIKILPYKTVPRCYNIFFDNVGIAIDLENQYFIR